MHGQQNAKKYLILYVRRSLVYVILRHKKVYLQAE